MKRFTVVVEETVHTAYTVEVEGDAQDACQIWELHGDECGPIDWSQCKSANIISVTQEKGE